ncbi:carbon-nitrogen hydrolase family protein [Cupriavidus sp. 30B13]|uniref:carbon-nitrogen hydrolase family protein n=1 Tax=Cupriavidus sp. 30B13 TaxID=3384241 RepID=UPI003B9212F1
MIQYPRYKAAAAHVSPVYFDIDRTVDKACDLIAEAARSDVRLLAFPESFIPGYPHWGRIVAPIETDELFAAMAARAIRIDGPEIARLRAAAARHEMVVSIGFNEGTNASVGCLWNSNVLIGSDGTILNHHRKLVPTYVEKLVWANGDGSGLRVSETDLGRIGMLICGENANPLARYTLMAQGEQVHISSYPSVAPARKPDGSGGYDIQDGIRIRAASHSFEAKVFNIVASTPFDDTARRFLEPLGKDVLALLENGSQTVSMILDPTGKPVSDVLSTDEGLCIAEIDLSRALPVKRIHDVVGYYNRFDIFDLQVNTSRNLPISWRNGTQLREPGAGTPAAAESELPIHLVPTEVL